MKTIRELMLSNKAWSSEMKERKKDYFAQQTAGQDPEIMWIGGSDSRVAPHQITQTRPGELFIHRNLANLIYQDDDNLLADLQHAVDDFAVEHIVLCGHYGCSGIGAAMSGDTTGHMHSWLSAARAVYEQYRTELDAIANPVSRQNRLAELNVREQLLRLSKLDVIEAALGRGQPLVLHGWIYDMRDGQLTELFDIDPATGPIDLPMPPKVISAFSNKGDTTQAPADREVA